MNKKSISVILLIAAIALGVYLIFNKEEPRPVSNENVPTAFDGRNSSFTIDGKEVTLINGTSEMESARGSTSEIATTYFGNEVKGDLTGDGVSDTAFMISQSTGGSGLFYYTVVAVKTENGYKTTNAFFIGDRIAPQNMYIPKGSMELQVNYAERKQGEPMTAQPSQGATKLLKVTSEGKLEGLMK